MILSWASIKRLKKMKSTFFLVLGFACLNMIDSSPLYAQSETRGHSALQTDSCAVAYGTAPQGPASANPQNSEGYSLHGVIEGCSETFSTSSSARAPVLISFDGVDQLAQEALRQRMITRTLGFTLTIDAEGNPAGCELSYRFRLKATRIAMCRPLLNYMRFEPAVDSNGAPTTGTYSSEFDLYMGIQPRRRR